ncbi:hypothetical protein HAX54_027803 [Datura stramonium]|uniref:Uncharacterized protein n=1 Tax=Datura stramonium TaxID=4076 RepID=A0ABS8V5X0_DATST|nr:hypothetical protein [Datura stramonium]
MDINMECFDDDDADAIDYMAKLENPYNYYTWISSLIEAGTPTWAIEGGKIFKSDLNIQAEHWLGFVCSRLTPSKNNNEEEMNSKLKKRKSEPHLSEASLTPDTQTMGNTATNTSTQASDEALASSLAPPIAPQPMQTLSAVRMDQDLEHRESALKGIGAVEALAALRADMSKVKNDIHITPRHRA